MNNNCRNEAEGNAVLLVIIDSSANYWDHLIVDETIFSALNHFGFPYRIVDLANKRLNADELNNCAGIILAQSRICESLTNQESQLISETVQQGIGLVNFDNDLRLMKSALREIFGFEEINPHSFVTNVIRIKSSEHYITEMQGEGEYHHSERMVTGIIAEKWRDDVTTPVEGMLGKEQLTYIRHITPWSAFEPKNYPVLFACQWGSGRATQFALNPRMWRKGYFGHARGLDDLFWRSIIWTVRKPFATHMIPPFVTLSIDDCQGRHDFDYVDLCKKYGYKPLPSLFLKDVPSKLFPKIKQDMVEKKAQYNTHALSYYKLLTFDFGKGELSSEKLEANFKYDDEFWKQVGATPGTTNRMHWGEYGVCGLSYLKERNRMFFCPARQHGVMKADQNMDDGFHPYNLQTCYYDVLPQDPDFFAFSSSPERHSEDFLTGCTVNLRESESNDVEKAAKIGAERITKSLRDGFYAELITHEQKIGCLKLEEWDAIFSGINRLTEHLEIIYADHDEIGLYLKGKFKTHLTKSVVKNNTVECLLSGESDIPLRISVFIEKDDSIIREYTTIQPKTM